MITILTKETNLMNKKSKTRMLKKVFKRGNNSALILETLNKHTVSKDPALQKAFKEIMEKYGPLLKKLAENNE